MTWYNTGTVTTAASTAVVGSGTAWIANAASGMGIRLGGAIYEIASINSDTSITLATSYTGTVGAGQTYSLMPTQDYIRSLAAQVASLIATYSAIATNAGAGKFGDGTVASPGITFGSNTNTGFYKYGANAIGIATNGVFAAVVDVSGNLGIGTTPNAPLHIRRDAVTTDLTLIRANNQGAGLVGSGIHLGYAAVDFYGYRLTNYNNPSATAAGLFKLQRGTTTAWVDVLVSDDVGNVGINVTGQLNPSVAASKLNVFGTITAGGNTSTNGQVLLQGYYGSGVFVNIGSEYSTAGVLLGYGVSAGPTGGFISTYASVLSPSAVVVADSIKFFTGGYQTVAIGSASSVTERLRIDPAGVLIVNKATYVSGAGAACKLQVLCTGAESTAAFSSTHASTPFGIRTSYDAAAPNGTGNEFLVCADTGATRAAIRSNGGLANFSANNVNLSDARTKTDIQPAPSYYSRWQALQFRTFLYLDQTDSERNLGVIAQEIEAVCPELVDVSGFGETPADGVPMRAIYQTDFQYATAMALQEAIAVIESLRARLTVLESGK